LPDKITPEQWESEEHRRDRRGKCMHPACRCLDAVQKTLLRQGVSASQAADVLRSLLEMAGGYMIIPVGASRQQHTFCQIRIERSISSKQADRSFRD